MAAIDKKKKNNIIFFLNTNFNIFIFLVIIIFLIVSYFLIIKPKFDFTLSVIKDNIMQKEQFYQQQKQKLLDLQAAVAMYRQISESDILKIKAVLPNEYAKEKLFGELEDIIAQQGLLITGIDLEKIGEDNDEEEPMANKDERLLDIPNSERVGIIRATIKLASVDYASLKNLLAILENHVQLIDINSIDFDQEEKTAQLSLYTYYFK